MRHAFSRACFAALALTSGLLACSAQTQPATTTGGAQTVTVRVDPQTATVQTGGGVQFAAAVTGTADTRVSWKVVEQGGGSVTAGAYAAPSTAGVYHVQVASLADPSRIDTATVTVTATPPPPPPPPPPAVTVTLSPPSGSTNTCRTLQLAATVANASDTSVGWTVQEGTAGGSVSASGLYTAPVAPGTYHVIATSHADATAKATAAITVTEKILSVAIAPGSVSVQAGGATTFTASVTTTCGTYAATP